MEVLYNCAVAFVYSVTASVCIHIVGITVVSLRAAWKQYRK